MMIRMTIIIDEDVEDDDDDDDAGDHDDVDDSGGEDEDDDDGGDGDDGDDDGDDICGFNNGCSGGDKECFNFLNVNPGSLLSMVINFLTCIIYRYTIKKKYNKPSTCPISALKN